MLDGLENERSSVNEYALSQEKAHQLTAELLQERPPKGDDRYLCYRIDGDDKFAAIGRKVEGEVFEEAFGNDPDQMMDEYGPYEHQSSFLISIDKEKQIPTGVLRVIKNGPSGQKTINDLMERFPSLTLDTIKAHHNIDDFNKCWDIGTVAVPREHRSKEGAASVQLYRGLYVAAMSDDIKHFVALIDEKPLNKLTKYLGIPFEPLANLPTFDYLGSEKSQPVYGNVAKFETEMHKRQGTIRGFLARKALARLVKGSQDSELQF